jgi:acyl-CoA thioester hydrolase
MPENMRLAHQSRIVLRWGDLDAFGHLNNVQYFRFMEQCRVEWLEKLGLFPSVSAAGRVDGALDAHSGSADAAPLPAMPVVASLNCSFKVPIHYPATLAVALFVGRAGRSSLDTWHTIRSADGAVLYAEGGATLVWIDVRSGRSAPLPPRVRAETPDSESSA